ncbi:hypothetical protein AAG570_011277 [Ranatra chinensis]|uniref:AB hydrolase-1 domain-containing protein n=1 Tax=Ranatra chinensis TaxID=642074 RepID=A0ABD0YKD8_9HEMI
MIAKQVFKRVWNYKKVQAEENAKPPSFLTDTSLGQHFYIKLKGVKLHYVETGIKTKPLVILLHGFPDCWITWRYQIPELAKHFRVVAVDLKGFGDSDKPESQRNYKVDKLIEELREFVHALGSQRCIVIGHDIGALFGWLLAHFHPELVDKLIVLASPHPNLYWSTLPKSAIFNTRWIQFCQLPYLPELQALDDNLSVIALCYFHLVKNNGKHGYLDAYKYVFSRREDWTGPINYFRNLPFWKLKTSEQGSMVPTLLIIGNKDCSVNMESVIRSTEYAEKSLLKVVEGASHYLHQEKPNVVNKLLLSFLKPKPQQEPLQNTNGLVNKVLGVATNNALWKQYSGYFVQNS